MTLDEYIEEMKCRLSRFEGMWREGNSQKPEQYPMSFEKDDAGQWDEQFDLFVEVEHHEIFMNINRKDSL